MLSARDRYLSGLSRWESEQKHCMIGHKLSADAAVLLDSLVRCAMAAARYESDANSSTICITSSILKLRSGKSSLLFHKSCKTSHRYESDEQSLNAVTTVPID